MDEREPGRHGPDRETGDEGVAGTWREEFLTMMAHDLRSPLGAISISAEVLLDFDLEEDARRYHLEVIQRATSRMSRIIQDLQDVTRLEQGTLELESHSHDLTEILDEICGSMLNRAQSRSVELVWSVHPRVGQVSVDRYRLLQVLGNAIEYAQRQTRSGGTVTVRAVADGGEAIVTVSDQGPAVPADDLPHIFDRYWHARRPGGTSSGLGLAIAKGIIERHGGRMWFESRPEGGNRLSFSLTVSNRGPQRSAASRRAAARTAASR